MTRQFHNALRSLANRKLPARTPNPFKYSFTCFRLVPIYDREPGEQPYASIELLDTTNAMRTFIKQPPTLLSAKPRARSRSAGSRSTLRKSA